MTRSKMQKRRIPPSSFAKIYYDPSESAGYTGDPRKLAKAVGSTTRQAEHWLMGEQPYTRFKAASKHHHHSQIFVQGLDEMWSIDLISVIPLAPDNDGYKYILTTVDTLSKYAFARPLKTKTGSEVARALADIFRHRKPLKIRSDLGREFYNSDVQKLFKINNIRHIPSYNYTKAAQVERFNRTLRAKMWRYFEATNVQRYVEVLPKLLDSYNHTIHRSTNMMPAGVNVMNQSRAWNSLYGSMVAERKAWRVNRKPGELPRPTDLRVNDFVRLSKAKHAFEKGYTEGWTKEIFRVQTIIPPLRGVKRSRHRFRVIDLDDEPVLGTFYREELQKVRQVDKQIKKVVKRSKSGKVVTWRGYPINLQTFIPTSAKQVPTKNLDGTHVWDKIVRDKKSYF